MIPVESSPGRVLVTGATGFVAMNCVLQLLQQGYQVRGTLRELSRSSQLRSTLAQHVEGVDRLELVRADLLSDNDWDSAVSGCDYVLHVASPVPLKLVKHEDELILPARDGTMRVLRAAAAGGVKRVVLTSSIDAAIQGHGLVHKQFTENDWSNLDVNLTAYQKSKTLAERAAWQFVDQPDNVHLEMAVINPGFVFGPVMDTEFRSSSEPIRKLMLREVPGVGRIMFPLADVRDVATAHLKAMVHPDAAGQRFFCVGSICSLEEIAMILDHHFSERGYRVPTRILPDFLFRLVGLFDSSVRLVIPDLNKPQNISTERIRTVLGWEPRSKEEAIISMAESMIKYGLI
ncbi:MAG: aldehyde reductase [Nitrosomonadaceae bacterium]